MLTPRFKALTRKWIGIILTAYFVLLVIHMFMENSIVYPAPKYPAGFWNTTQLGCEDVFFESADGTKLNGWYFSHANARGNLLFCHGNGEHLGYLGEEMAELRDSHRLNVFVFDYRGYGRCEGSPHEAGVLADTVAARDWLAKRAGIVPADVILMGRSIGGGAAVDLAARDGAKGLILWNTFSSMPAVGAYHFPWLPVRFVMRNRYDSLSKIPNYRGPLLQTHGTADSIIPFKLAEQLFAAATTSDKQFIPIRGGDHNDAPGAAFTEALRGFINRVCSEGKSEIRNSKS